MKYIRIRIIEHRDNVAYKTLQQAAADLNDMSAAADAANRQASDLENLAKQSQLPSDIDIAAGEKAKAKALASAIITARMKVQNASEHHSKMSTQNRLCGAFGYQEIDSSKMEVLRLLDEAGNPFPKDAVFGYEVVDAEPPMPIWGVPDL